MSIPMTVKLRFLPVAIYHRLLSWTRGRGLADTRTRDLLYRIARNDLSKRFGEQRSLAEVETSLRHIYATAGKHQTIEILHEEGQIDTTTVDCVFHRACCWYGMPGVTQALCDADRDFWDACWPNFSKQNRFQLGGVTCKAQWRKS